MLGWRLISSAIILAILTALLWLDLNHAGGASGIWLAPLVILLTLLATSELLSLLQSGGFAPSRAATYAGTLLVVLAACVPIAWPLMGTPYPADCPLGRLGWPLGAMAVALLLVFMAEMRRYHEPGKTVLQVALATFVITYLGISFAFLVALRLLEHRWGMLALISAVAVVKMADTGAYFTGRYLGRHKMAPVLSPKKTWEGAIGAVLAGCFASWLIFTYVAPWLTGEAARDEWWRWTTYGLLLAVVGMIGDLAESLIKRDVQRKDSSSWLPGLGGVLDTLDSLLVVAPIAYLCWVAGLVGAR